MSKQISATELATIVTNLLTGESSDLDSHDSFQGFMTDLAQLVCNYCGGEVKNPAARLDDTWYVGIHGNDSVPDEFGGIWREFDPEGELFGDLESLECTITLTHEASETDPEAERAATDYRYKVFLARAIGKDGLTSSEKSEIASAVLDKFFVQIGGQFKDSFDLRIVLADGQELSEMEPGTDDLVHSVQKLS